MHHLTSASSTKTTTSSSNEKTIRHTILNSNSTVMSRYLPLRTQICRANKLMVGRWSFPNILPFQGGKNRWFAGFSGAVGQMRFLSPPGSAWWCSSALPRANGDGSWRCGEVEEIGLGHLEVAWGKYCIFNPPGNQHDWQIPISFWNRRYIFIHGGFSIDILVKIGPFQKERIIFRPQCFRCYVSFREGNTHLTDLPINPPLPARSSTPPRPGLETVTNKMTLHFSRIGDIEHETFICHWHPGWGVVPIYKYIYAGNNWPEGLSWNQQLLADTVYDWNPAVSYPTNWVLGCGYGSKQCIR